MSDVAKQIKAWLKHPDNQAQCEVCFKDVPFMTLAPYSQADQRLHCPSCVIQRPNPFFKLVSGIEHDEIASNKQRSRRRK